MGCGVSKAKEINNIVADSIENLSHPATLNESFIVENHKKFTEVYKIGKTLGTGGFGEVRLVIHRLTNQERAVKIFRKAHDFAGAYSKVKSEIEIMKKLCHPIIVKIYEYFEDEKRVYLILEKCDGGELFEEVFKRKFLSENIAALISKQLFSVVSYLHDKNIAHRDIKPENILLEEREDFVNIKIIDFGAAVSFTPKTKMIEMIGSPFYIAPEVANYNYNEKCDEWSCGVILYILLSGVPPFPGNTNEEIIARIKKGFYSFDQPIWGQISNDAKDLIQKLLCPVRSRISAKEALLHPWIQSQASYPKPNTSFFNSVVDNLKTFHSKSKLKDAISVFITSQVITTHDTKELRELFKTIDANGDGKLSKEEIKDGLKMYQGIDAPDEYVDKIICEVDTDGDGYVDYDEFIKATLNENVIYSKGNLKKAFDLFDLDGSGKISLNELNFVFVDKMVDKQILVDFIKEADVNSDGEIDFDEFCSFITKISIHVN